MDTKKLKIFLKVTHTSFNSHKQKDSVPFQIFLKFCLSLKTEIFRSFPLSKSRKYFIKNGTLDNNVSTLTKDTLVIL